MIAVASSRAGSIGRSQGLASGLVGILFDGGFAWCAFWLAYLLRYQGELGGTILPADWESFATFHGKAVLFVILTVAVLTLRGTYRLPRWTGLLDETSLVVGGLTTAMSGVILWAFFLRFAPSRLVFIYAWALAIALFVMRRASGRAVRRWFWARGIGVDRVLVVGAGQIGRRIMQAMMGQPDLGYRLVGFVDNPVEHGPIPVATEHRIVHAKRLGTPDEVGEVVVDYRVDEVIIALPAADHERVLAIVGQCRARDVTFKVVPDLFQLSIDRVDLAEVAGVPLIGLKASAITGTSYLVKRTMDLIIAIAILTMMAMPMAIIAWLIRRDSPGPVLWRQPRVGHNGTPFILTKFRTMVAEAEHHRSDLIAVGSANGDADPRLFKMRDDPRLTNVGRLLRRFSLDELPQFVHVLRGQMSVVGPRPPLPDEVGGYEEWHEQRLMVTPGLTGLWQVNGRSNLSFDEMVRLDLYYAEHWSPWLDVKIMLRTIPAVLTGNGAY